MADKPFVSPRRLKKFLTNLLGEKLNTKEEVLANTDAKKFAGAMALQEMFNDVTDSLVNENSESFNFGVKDGVRGFFTDPSRADDCFIPFSRVEDSIEFGLPFFARNEHVFPVTGYRTLRLICTKSYQDNYTWGFNILGWKKDVMTDIPAWTFDTSKYTIKTTNGDVIYTKSNPGSSFLNTEVTVDISEYDYIVFASNGWGGEYWLNI